MSDLKLMVGDIVTVDNLEFHPKLKGVPLVVTGYKKCLDIDDRTIWTYCYDLEHINKLPKTLYQDYSQLSRFIQPITLTPDVLERIGFINKSNDWTLDITFEFKVMIYNESYYNGFMAYTRTIHTDWTPVYSMAHFKHLHTLQQLIRLFTGKEIEVKW